MTAWPTEKQAKHKIFFFPLFKNETTYKMTAFAISAGMFLQQAEETRKDLREK